MIHNPSELVLTFLQFIKAHQLRMAYEIFLFAGG